VTKVLGLQKYGKAGTRRNRQGECLGSWLAQAPLSTARSGCWITSRAG
jgi:hypothetical protein